MLIIHIQEENDVEAQKLYAASRKKESVFMSIKDKLELSWQFLYDITNIVLNKFSKTDREATLAMGHIILDNGGRYEHVVDYGIRQEASSRDPNKSKEQVR
jgi:predicted 3-demethylubiquinone-9 3-methyltransferase (glyoxalase superfamily)